MHLVDLDADHPGFKDKAYRERRDDIARAAKLRGQAVAELYLRNDWTVKIGRGLDFFQRPVNWFSVGANDLGLRKCLETKVDIYRRS